MVVTLKEVIKYSILILIIIPQISASKKTSEDCGIPYEARGYSYGGKEIGRYDYPWLVKT